MGGKRVRFVEMRESVSVVCLMFCEACELLEKVCEWRWIDAEAFLSPLEEVESAEAVLIQQLMGFEAHCIGPKSLACVLIHPLLATKASGIGGLKALSWLHPRPCPKRTTSRKPP